MLPCITLLFSILDLKQLPTFDIVLGSVYAAVGAFEVRMIQISVTDKFNDNSSSYSV